MTLLYFFKISFLLGAILPFFVGLAVFSKGKEKSINISFFFLSISSAVWSIGFLFLLNSTSYNTAYIWRLFMDFGSILLPAFWVHFVLIILDQNKINVKVLFLSYLVAIIIVSLNIMEIFYPGIFIIKLEPKLIFDYYPTAGFGYYLLILYYLVSIPSSLILLFKKIKKSHGVDVLQLKFIFIAALIGFLGGGMAFLPTFNLLILPISVIFFPIYPVIIAYAILKYHLFNIKLILVEMSLLFLNLFLLVNVFLSQGGNVLILNAVIFVAVLTFSTLLLRGIYKDIRDRERIEGLVRDLAVANDRLRYMEQQKTEFVSIASHQLRTPLTAIKGYASMALEGSFGQLTDKAREAMDTLYKVSEKIALLVDDLLTVSWLEQGRAALEFHTIDLAKLARDVLDKFEEEVVSSGHRFLFEHEERKKFLVSVDEQKMMQIVRHILENAIQYSPSPSMVRASLFHDEESNMVRLMVSDTGKGMTKDQIASLVNYLDPVRDDPAKSDTKNIILTEAKVRGKGSEQTEIEQTPGIGLYIANEILHAHKGHLRVMSPGLDKGTTFTIELPAVGE